MQERNKEERREHARRRVRAATDPEHYAYFPEKNVQDNLRGDVFQRVAVYARVSTPDPSQTTSFELQQKYYTDLVNRHPNWELVKIYADEGKSGTTTEHREAFNQMIQDALDGKIDLIIVKSISRFARNIVTCLSTLKQLAEKRVGVFFESEMIYSLNDTNHLALSFSASVAEEESRIRSRSMVSSLKMRLDHGLPLTPEMLGFRKNADGKLVKDPETYKIPKLMFYMYLYGYSTQQIAEVLTRLAKRTYQGNLKWSADGVAGTLRSERYCGDVITWKRYRVFAADVIRQKTFKNRGERTQSHYINEHEAIVSHDDFLAVQRIMNNAKYGGTSLLPCLRVIPDGLLKGFVVVHPKWGSFTKEDYIRACRSVEDDADVLSEEETGNPEFEGSEIVDVKMFSDLQVPAINLQRENVRFSASCIRKMNCGRYVELLVHPIRRQLAVRPAPEDDRCRIAWCSDIKQAPRPIACKAYIETLFQIFDWNLDYKYKLYGCVYREGDEAACVFSDADAGVYIRKEDFLSADELRGKLLNASGSRIRAVTGNLGNRFGESYAEDSRRRSRLTKEEWQTRIAARMCEPLEKLNVTPYEELREFIRQELGDELFEEVQPL